MILTFKRLGLLTAAGGILALTGCTTMESGPASIVDHSSYSEGGATATQPTLIGGVTDSGRVHTVAPGDTLYNISVRYGFEPKSLAALNAITDPTQLRIGQVLRLPESTTAPREYVPNSGVRISRVTADTPVEAPASPVIRNAETVPAAPQTDTPASSVTQTPAAPAAQPASPAETAPAVVPGSRMLWPVSGKVLTNFGGKSMGIDIAGTNGDVVVAAMPGEVIFVGNTVKNYTNLVIVKHSPTLVTAYSNNSRVVVKQGDNVRSGQKIAEVGVNGSGTALLHFEVREKGKPVDPMSFLPKR